MNQKAQERQIQKIGAEMKVLWIEVLQLFSWESKGTTPQSLGVTLHSHDVWVEVHIYPNYIDVTWPSPQKLP